MKGCRQTFLPNEGLCPTSCNLAIPQTAPSLKKTTNPLTSLPLLLRFKAGYSGGCGGCEWVPFLLSNHNGGTELVGCGPNPHGYPRSSSFLSGSKLSLLCTHGTSQRETGGISLWRCQPGGLHESQTDLGCRCNAERLENTQGNTPDGNKVSSVVPLSNPQSPCTGVLPELVPLLFPSWLFQLQCGGNNETRLRQSIS